MKRSNLATLLAWALLAGCAPKEINYTVSIVSQSCDPNVDPFAGVTWVRVQVSGDGITPPLTATALKDGPANQLVLPEIPVGPNRIVEVRAYDSDPSSGSAKVLALGRSLPFVVPEKVPADLAGPIAINVFLRKVNAFNSINSAAAPGTCQKLRLPRAGHSATLLNNGKVYIAGGFNYGVPSTGVRAALFDAEIFNPATGTFDAARDIAVNSGITKIPKAFHTATRLPSGQVLLWGGETYFGTSANNLVVVPTTSVAIYDPDVNDYYFFPPENQRITRSQHAAVVDANGRVLIVGGVSGATASGMTPTDKVQWFDPTNNSVSTVKDPTDSTGVRDLSFPRIGAAVAAVRQGTFVAVAGGSDGTKVLGEISFFKFANNAFGLQSTATSFLLREPRRAAGVATMRDGDDFLLLGGYSDPAQVKPIDSTEIVSTKSSTIAAGPLVGKRGDLCAVTMPDGSVLTIGGRALSGTVAVSDGSTVSVTADTAGGATALAGPALATPRYAHTCTLLADGSVLVTGGINDQADGSSAILQDAWIFQPAPKTN